MCSALHFCAWLVISCAALLTLLCNALYFRAWNGGILISCAALFIFVRGVIYLYCAAISIFVRGFNLLCSALYSVVCCYCFFNAALSIFVRGFQSLVQRSFFRSVQFCSVVQRSPFLCVACNLLCCSINSFVQRTLLYIYDFNNSIVHL